jgi:hypothetical protein
MLLMMKSLTQAARGLAYTAAATLDVAHTSGDGERRGAAARRADLLTPIVKAWCSEVAVEVASLGVQVHGGMGYVDDAEISQVYRDARIGPIFEGTNYIQAQDLLGRKVLRDDGSALGELLADIEKAAQASAAHATLLQGSLLDGCARMRKTTAELIARFPTEPHLVGATAYHFLHWLGTLAGGWQLALLAARARTESSTTEARAIGDLASFYGAHIMPRTSVHEAAVRHGADTVVKISPADI